MLPFNEQGMPVMVFSIDETTNKAVVYAGVPEKSEQSKLLEVSEWLTNALGPLKGRCGRGKGGLATGQVGTWWLKFNCCEKCLDCHRSSLESSCMLFLRLKFLAFLSYLSFLASHIFCNLRNVCFISGDGCITRY